MPARKNPRVRHGMRPLKFSRERISMLPTQEDMLAYARARLLPLGAGSAREVFYLGSHAVLKIAKNQFGREQNEQEARVGSNSDVSAVVARILDVAPDGESWLVSEYAAPFQSEEQFDQRVMPMYEFSDLLRYMQKEHSLVEAVRTYFRTQRINVKKNLEYFRWMRKSPFLKAMYDLIHTYDFGLGDLDRFEHYGVTADGRVVLIDYGFRGFLGHSHW